MMPHRATMASTLLLAISLSAAWAAEQNVWDECNQTRDTGASIAACTQILLAPDEATSNRAIAYYVRAGAYKTKGDNDHAIADYTKAIEADAHYADAYSGRGIVHQIKGDNEDAIADYTKAIEIDPRYASAYLGRGMVYRLLGDSDQPKPSRSIRATRLPTLTAVATFNRSMWGTISDRANWKGVRGRAT